MQAVKALAKLHIRSTLSIYPQDMLWQRSKGHFSLDLAYSNCGFNLLQKEACWKTQNNLHFRPGELVCDTRAI